MYQFFDSTYLKWSNNFAANCINIKNLSKLFRHPFVVYADCECLCAKVHTATPLNRPQFYRAHGDTFAISYALIALNVKSKIIFHEYLVGENTVQHFLSTLKVVTDKLIARMKIIITMKVSGSYGSHPCVLCKKPFAPGDKRPRHHEQYIGNEEMVGLTHQACNLNYRSTFFIPVLIHNLKCNDSHLILKHLPREYSSKVRIIPSICRSSLVLVSITWDS